MTRTFKVYSVIWAICFIMLNIITFVSPLRINIISGNFWIGYFFIVIAFVGQLICSYIAFKEENIKKMFYNTSLVLISYICFIVLLITASFCLVNPIMPMSIGISICMIVSGIFAVLVIITCFVIKVVSEMDDEITTKTFTMKSLTMNAEHLINKASSEEIKQICEKVYESFRYSNTMSDNSVKDINEQIQREFISFENAINESDLEMAKNISKELITLINKRNLQSKLNK